MQKSKFFVGLPNVCHIKSLAENKTDLNAIAKTIKNLEENICISFYDLQLFKVS